MSVVRVARLGGGTFGEVFKLSSGLAGKLYKHSKEKGQGLARDAVKEISLLAGLSCDHIVALRGTHLQGQELWCLMDCAPHGDLRRYLKDCKLEAPQHAAEIAFQMFSGLGYLHSRNVVHRDVKPENFLVFSISPEVVIKISDLGSALVHGCTQPPQITPRTDPVSTLWYRSPEVAFGLTNMHGPAMDVWAAGLILCELVHPGTPIFSGVDDDAEFMSTLCAKFGTPDLSNDIMPSFNRAKQAGQLLSTLPKPKVSDVPPYVAFWYPPWAVCLLQSTLVMEPSRRMPAENCAMTLTPSSHKTCPKTPKVVQSVHKMEAFSSALRALAGDILFETCVHKNFDRRAFHAAVRILDVECADESILSSLENRLPTICAAAASIASKLCETAGINPNWGPDLRIYAIGAGRQPRGIGRFVLKAEEVEAEEVRILSERVWNVWDVLVIDVPTPKGVNPQIYAYVCDILASHMGTNECTPYDMAEIAGVLSTAIEDPKAQRAFPSKLMGVLEIALDAINSIIADRSPVKEKHVTVCGQIILNKVKVDFETIKWI